MRSPTLTPKRSIIRRQTCVRMSLVLLCLMVLLILMLLSLFIGAKNIAFAGVLEVLFQGDSSPESITILWARLPRTIIGVLAGMALGTAGAVIQAFTRNPLADPGILGVNAGANFAIAIGILWFGISGIQGYLGAAFTGALLTSILVYFVGSSGGKQVSPIQLTLAGIAIGAVLSGITYGIRLQYPYIFDQLRFWDAGSLDIRNFNTLIIVSPVIIVGCIIAQFVARPLNLINMGVDLASALGVRTRYIPVWALITITLLCGAATAAAGPIGFVGLIIPHIARWLVGSDQSWIMRLSMVLGPILLLSADIIGRIIAPTEIRVSIVTAFIGAPVLIWLVRSNKKIAGL